MFTNATSTVLQLIFVCMAQASCKPFPPVTAGCLGPQEVLYCARKAGVTHVLKAGGAQAVAAMAWGTESCPKVSHHDLT